MDTLVDLLHSDLFRTLAPSIRLEVYGKDGGPLKVRRRIELVTGGLDAALLRQALEYTCGCVHCDRPMHPFRPRIKGLGDRVELARHVYMAVACPLDVCVGCSRGTPSREAYLLIREVVEKLQSQPTEPLPKPWRWTWLGARGWAATNGSDSVFVQAGVLTVLLWGPLASTSFEYAVKVPAAVVSAVLRTQER